MELTLQTHKKRSTAKLLEKNIAIEKLNEQRALQRRKSLIYYKELN